MTIDQRVKRHPVKGGLFGLMLGISAAYFLYFQFAVFGFDTVNAVAIRFGVIILIGVAVGVVWAYVAPPRKPKELAPPPSVVAPEAPAWSDAPEAPAWSDAPEAPPWSDAPEAPPAEGVTGPETAWETEEPEEA